MVVEAKVLHVGILGIPSTHPQVMCSNQKVIQTLIFACGTHNDWPLAGIFLTHGPKICQTRRTPTCAALVSCGTQDALNQEELLKALIIQMSCRRRFKCFCMENELEWTMALGGVLPQSSFAFPNNCGKMQPTSLGFGQVFLRQPTSKRQTYQKPPAGLWFDCRCRAKVCCWRSKWRLLLEELCPFWCCWWTMLSGGAVEISLKVKALRLKDVNFVINNAISQYDIDYINWLFRFCPSNQQKHPK